MSDYIVTGVEQKNVFCVLRKAGQRGDCYYSNRLSYWTSHFDGAAKTISITGPIFQLLFVMCQNIPYVPFPFPFPST